MSLLASDDHLEREAAADAAELQRITQPLPLDVEVSHGGYVIRYGCTGMCSQGDAACDCGAAPITSAHVAAAEALRGWRGLFAVEWDHPALIPLYVIVAVGAAALSALFPWGFGS